MLQLIRNIIVIGFTLILGALIVSRVSMHFPIKFEGQWHLVTTPYYFPQIALSGNYGNEFFVSGSLLFLQLTGWVFIFFFRRKLCDWIDRLLAPMPMGFQIVLIGFFGSIALAVVAFFVFKEMAMSVC